jgi:hypothetical protein
MNDRLVAEYDALLNRLTAATTRRSRVEEQLKARLSPTVGEDALWDEWEEAVAAEHAVEAEIREFRGQYGRT